MTNTPLAVGLVGARGYAGRELVRLIDQEAEFTLTLATSREHAGKHVSDVFEDVESSVVFEASGPVDVALAGCDVIILGLPNGLAAPYVDAINEYAPDTLVIDLSTDYRFQSGWTFGLSDLIPTSIRGVKRIANPGCYATAAILALYPIRDYIDGIPSVFGLSGFSGAGTTPNPRNDPERLADNILPYSFGGHSHEKEIALAIDHAVRFMPHVAPFFRGLLTTQSVPLRQGVSLDNVMARYRDAYADSSTVFVQEVLPEIRDVVGTPNAIIGGAAIQSNTNMLAVTCVHDNLLKGAAAQAMANLKLALGMSA